ncbi:hypothetical protein H2201_002038 [Coniosporium apollinis]|uniref:Uncharacterized protein n=2 Tax=Coniosporium TaxID=2810619 RepID=A0ABQ9P644_9PEZI|nr:hypothetical protein H2199_000871 [Cladosporium sp. JES 115]KAJ9667852.1 hypothetical protein H2201_002038 [Coniosporium apollinis]
MSSNDNDEEPQQKGLLSSIGDPVGKVLGTGLAPVGGLLKPVTAPATGAVGNITRPVLGPLAGEHKEKMEVIGGDNKDSYAHGKDSIGGELQTADNPLGLEQTGKWGFEEEK